MLLVDENGVRQTIARRFELLHQVVDRVEHLAQRQPDADAGRLQRDLRALLEMLDSEMLVMTVGGKERVELTPFFGYLRQFVPAESSPVVATYQTPWASAMSAVATEGDPTW